MRGAENCADHTPREWVGVAMADRVHTVHMMRVCAVASADKHTQPIEI